MSPLRTDVDQLRSDVDRLVGIVETLGEVVGSGAAPAPRTQSRREVAAFVAWLNERYALPSDRRVPSCWYRHGPAVEELTALHAAWLAADESGGDGPIAWHDRWLWPCLDRLYERQFRRCDREHHDRPPPRPSRTDAGLEAWIAADPPPGRPTTPRRTR